MALFKIDAWNRISWWNCFAEGNTAIIRWGLMIETCAGPKEPTSYQENRIDFPTPEEAVEEVRRRTTKQINRNGYSQQIPKAPPLLPMLAQEYDKDKTYEWPTVFLQPKLDGVRCIGSSVQMLSRRDLPYTSVPYVQKALNWLPSGVKLDGELYIHGVSLDTISGYVRRNNPSAFHYLIEYHVFDWIDTESPYYARKEVLESMVAVLEERWKEEASKGTVPDKFPIKIVNTHFLEEPIYHEKTLNAIRTWHTHYKNEGYEGVMLRHSESPYEIDKRSPFLLKYKERMDSEFEIVGVVEGRGSSSGEAIFVCKTAEGAEFTVFPAYTKARKRQIFRNKEAYLGRWLRVSFINWTNIPTRVPRQPIGHEIIYNKDDLK